MITIQQFRKWMQDNNISQQQIADALNDAGICEVTQARISMVLSGEPNAEWQNRLRRARWYIVAQQAAEAGETVADAARQLASEN